MFVVSLHILRASKELVSHQQYYHKLYIISKLWYTYTNHKSSLHQKDYRSSSFYSQSGTDVRLSRSETDSSIYSQFPVGVLYRMIWYVRPKFLYHRVFNIIISYLNYIIFNTFIASGGRHWMVIVLSYIFTYFSPSL